MSYGRRIFWTSDTEEKRKCMWNGTSWSENDQFLKYPLLSARNVMMQRAKLTNSRLVISSGIEIQLFSNKEILVNKNGQPVTRCNSWGLAIFDAFSNPTTIKEAVEYINPRVKGREDWMHLTDTILQLIDKGVLIEENATSNNQVRNFSSGFDRPQIHIKMLNDFQRTNCYIQAINEVIRPSDIVLDIGTGTGILAIAAAKAGAKKVYAIEAGRKMCQIAQKNFEANNLDDRITIIEGWSTKVNLPEKATVLVSEIIGSHPLDEGILNFTRDAKSRLLTKNARLIPNNLKVIAKPVNIPASIWSEYNFMEEVVVKWERIYNMKFSGMLSDNALHTNSILMRPSKAAELKAFCPPVLLADIDLSEIQPDYTKDHCLVSITSGTLNGIITYCEAQLAENILMSTNPTTASDSMNWNTHISLTSNPLVLDTGSTFRLKYQMSKGIVVQKSTSELSNASTL